MATAGIFKDDILKGKVAFVTGGGSGICRGMTEALLFHGAKAVIVSRSKDRLDEAAKEMSKKTQAEVLSIAADVRKPKEVIEAVEKTIEHFGRIDILINGAAGNFLAPAENLSYRGFQTVIEIDLLGTYNVTKTCFPHLKKSKGSVINVSAMLHGLIFQAHASAAKTGVDSLTKTLAVEWGPLGIRVNAIAPGSIEGTEGMDKLLPPTVAEQTRHIIPLQRWGRISDIANMTVFLASDAASFVTGQIIAVDGGESLRKPMPLPYPQAVLNPEEYTGEKLGVKL